MRLADLNGDGRLDAAAVVGHGSSVGLEVLTGDGHGDLALGGTFPLKVVALHFAVADVNGDRRPDVVAPGLTNGTVDVLLNLAPSLVVSIPPLETVVRSGLPVTVGCLAACTLRTQLLLGASAARVRPPIVVGSATTRLRARGTRRIRVPLTARGRRLLSGKRRVRLTVKTTALRLGRPAGVPATRTVVLR